jgi:dihydrolipoamide dehydrogenase
MMDYDVIVIGAGPGGYVAAIRASQLGLKTAIIEKQHFGGVCLNYGCIPTKALLKSAEVFTYIKHAKDYGFEVAEPKFKLADIVSRSRKVSAKLASGISMLMKKNKIDTFEDTATLEVDKKIKLEKSGKVISGKNIIIATGARARVLKGFEPDGKQILTYKEAMLLEEMPKSILVVGSGAIGVEFASFYNSLGADVTILEAMDRILPIEDQEISNLATKAFQKNGIKIHTAIKLIAFRKSKSHVEIEFEVAGKKNSLNVEKVIMAVGVEANIENIGLEKTKVKIEKNSIVTDGFNQTAHPGIFAIGDVTRGPWLAHKASHEAITCVEFIAGKKVQEMDRSNIPGCTYSDPQIASIGITEQKAKEDGLKVRIGRFPFIGNGKAIAIGKEEGLIKVIFDEKTGELLGAHMIGADVTEIIHSFVVGKTMEATEEDFMHMIFAHPTLSEMVHEAVLNAYGRAIHI